jgi:predicted AAA+ superfamily ATPase
VLAERLAEPRRFLQVVAGPRQVGKSTLVQQVTGELGFPVRYASARYIADSLIETSIARDVLLLTRVDKPALLRRLFEAHAGTAGFSTAFKVKRTLLPGGDGISIEDFLSQPVPQWLSNRSLSHDLGVRMARAHKLNIRHLSASASIILDHP